MLVNFDFECFKCGIFEVTFDSKYFPSRNFPKEINCECGRIAEMVFTKINMQPDEYWSGKDIDSLGLKNVTSKSKLKRYLKDNNIAQLTSDEIDSKVRKKSQLQSAKEYLNRPDIVKERRRIISETLDGFGVIDKAV